MAVVTPAAIKAYFETGDVPSQSNFEDFVDSVSCGYKEYVAILTQVGTSAPVATVLRNTLGGTVVWTRNSAGSYTGTLSNAFSASTTVVSMNREYDIDNGYSIRAFYNSVSEISVSTFLIEQPVSLTDSILGSGNVDVITIRVYV